MTEPELPGGVRSEQPPAPDPNGSSRSLTRYYVANGERFTPEALDETARAAGYSEDAIAAAHGAIRRAHPAPVAKARARRAVLIAYLATYATLVALMLYNDRTRYGQSVISSIVLTVVLGTALVISLDLIGRARPDTQFGLRGLLAVPLLLLFAVSGVCLWSGEPIPRPDDPRPLNRERPAAELRDSVRNASTRDPSAEA